LYKEAYGDNSETGEILVNQWNEPQKGEWLLLQVFGGQQLKQTL
jgi:hypothetical protein